MVTQHDFTNFLQIPNNTVLILTNFREADFHEHTKRIEHIPEPGIPKILPNPTHNLGQPILHPMFIGLITGIFQQTLQ